MRAASPGTPGERGSGTPGERGSCCGARVPPAASPQPKPAAARLAPELPEPRLCFVRFQPVIVLQCPPLSGAGGIEGAGRAALPLITLQSSPD